MAAVYEQADESVHQMAREILEANHKERLRMPDQSFVILCIMFASKEDGESDEAPLKDGRYPAAGAISVIPYKQRVDKRADAEVLLDKREWEDATEPQQRALLDHLITHLELQRDDQGLLKTDDAGRPKLQVRLCDWFLKGFREIAQRYGDDAPEVIAARKFQKQFGETVLKAEEPALFAAV